MNLLHKYTGTKEFPVSSETSQGFSFHTNKHVDTLHTHTWSVCMLLGSYSRNLASQYIWLFGVKNRRRTFASQSSEHFKLKELLSDCSLHFNFVVPKSRQGSTAMANSRFHTNVTTDKASWVHRWHGAWHLYPFLPCSNNTGINPRYD